MSREIAIELREQAKGLRDLARELDSKAKNLEKDAEKREQEAEAEKRSLSVASAAGELDVSQETLRRWLKSGRVKGFQLPGGRWRIDPDSLQALVESSEPDPGVIDPHASRSRLVAVQGSLRERSAAA